MLSLILLSLLGTGLAVVAIDEFTSDDDDDGGNTSRAEDPDVIQGTNGDDILQAAQDQTANGFAGNDDIEANGESATLNGGAGSDTLTSIGNSNVLINGDRGDDLIIFEPSSVSQSDTGEAFGGEGNDTIQAFGIGGSVDGGVGDDVIEVQGSINIATGGEGNDTIFGDSADYGGGTPLFGDAGDDLLNLSNSPSFQIGATADGGMGNDTIQSTTYLFSSDSYDTLTGGEGADRFELDFQNAIFGTEDEDVGIVTTITDFVPGEDVLVLPANLFSVNSGFDTARMSFDIIEAADGAHTDFVFSALGPALSDTIPGTTITGAIRLEGSVGLSNSDVILLDQVFSQV
jgi:Ca2+-binding RTX toxin-like protein